MNRGKSRKDVTLVLVILILLLGILLVSTVACEPPIPIRVVNQTDQTLKVYIRGYLIGEVKPNEEIKNNNPNVAGIYHEYLIEAKNAQGNTIYSKEFTYEELNDMKYLVVISQSQ